MGLIWKKRKLEIRMLILVAIEEELKRSELPDHEIEYIGVGKVNAVFNTLNAIEKYSPTQIVNFGTAGSLDENIKGLVEVSSFFQRDMDASPLGFKVGQTPFEDDIDDGIFLRLPNFNSVDNPINFQGTEYKSHNSLTSSNADDTRDIERLLISQSTLF